MLPRNDYLAPPEFLAYRMDAIRAESEQRRLLREAGLTRRPWLFCQACRSLWQLGRLLAAAGRGLERRYAFVALSQA